MLRVPVCLGWKRRWRESPRAKTPEVPVGGLQGSGGDRWDQVYCSGLVVALALLCSEGWLAGSSRTWSLWRQKKVWFELYLPKEDVTWWPCGYRPIQNKNTLLLTSFSVWGSVCGMGDSQSCGSEEVGRGPLLSTQPRCEHTQHNHYPWPTTPQPHHRYISWDEDAS